MYLCVKLVDNLPFFIKNHVIHKLKWVKFMNMDIDKIKSDFGYEGVEKKKDHKRTVRYE